MNLQCSSYVAMQLAQGLRNDISKQLIADRGDSV